MSEQRMVVVAEYNTITEAEIGKSMLESAGIRAEIRNEFMSATLPVGIMPAQLMVSNELEEEARILLAQR